MSILTHQAIGTWNLSVRQYLQKTKLSYNAKNEVCDLNVIACAKLII